jgi:hypothetical protein
MSVLVRPATDADPLPLAESLNAIVAALESAPQHWKPSDPNPSPEDEELVVVEAQKPLAISIEGSVA